ncbi:MAG: hypothetical protein HON68_00845 [Gammaproteobacteria bacterium]|jgi:hypothetical protein|nr:hypothetical protein [Gammaproteobacteria bacterium]MBT3489472.1 hypothetical protein [Gammaproteobacteria bacterium]MBT3718624.1 hypothetical protein [Gammaproteobacteria bacterium]MBT3844781.1 hypothetical protein [Gammaproteobacteria bacterium]MBT3892808.1 hypothetical protein [Gammaproteobacteria bacterium]
MKTVNSGVMATTLIASMVLASSASAFWNPKDWDMKDGWGKGSDHPMAPLGWGSKDGRGPFGGENGWGAVDSMVDSMGMGDAMSDLNTDVEWDLNLDTQLKGKAHGEGKGSGEGKNRTQSRARSDVRHYGDQYNRPYYFGAPAGPQGYAPYPYAQQQPQMMGGAAPFAPAMPPMMPQQMMQQPMVQPQMMQPQMMQQPYYPNWR